MFRYCGVLPPLPIDTAVGGDSAAIIKYLNGCLCYAHIDLFFDILKKYGVVHLVYSDVIIELYGGLLPYTVQWVWQATVPVTAFLPQEIN